MKNKFFLILLITAKLIFGTVISARAQATYVQTISGYGNVVLFSANGEKIYTNDTVKAYLYNMDGSLWKTITFPSVPGYKGSTISAVSDNLFNADNLVELVVFYTPNAGSAGVYPSYKSILINETGSILQNIDTSYFGSVHYDETSNSYELFMYPLHIYANQEFSTNIYTLSGTMPCGQCGSLGTERLTANKEGITITDPTPNPSSGIVIINYSIPISDPSGILTFFNTNGQTMKTIPVFPQSNFIDVNNSTFKPGIYTYNIHAGNDISATKTMVIK